MTAHPAPGGRAPHARYRHALAGIDAPGFRRIAQTCRMAAMGSVAADTVVAAAPAELFALTRRHRLAAPVFEILARQCRDADPAFADPAFADRFAAAAQRKRARALSRTSQTATISRALSEAGLAHLAIKGPTLALQFYGDATARDSKDLDFLVEPAKLEAAATVLGGLGFHSAAMPAGNDADPAGGKHLTLSGHGIEIELHSRLVDVPALLPLSFDTLWRARATVLLGDVAVPVPAATHNLLYLCVHGAEHVWFRLKWLQDIARIVADRPDVVTETVLLAAELKMTAVVQAALRLVDDIFHLPAPIALPDDATVARLVRMSKAALVLPAELASAPSIAWLLRKLPVQWSLRRDWRYRRAFLRNLLFAPRSFDARPWPRWARWAYQPLRPFLLIRSRFGKAPPP